MKNNLQQLQEDAKTKILGCASFAVTGNIEEMILLAYNQGVKDSVEALPERLSAVEDFTGNEEFLDEAILNITKLIQ